MILDSQQHHLFILINKNNNHYNNNNILEDQIDELDIYGVLHCAIDGIINNGNVKKKL